MELPQNLFYYIQRKKKEKNIIPLTDHNCETQLLKRTAKKKFINIVSQNIGNREVGREGGE